MHIEDEQAWRDFRTRLATWIAERLEDVSMHRLFIDTPTGQYIKLVVDEDEVDLYYDGRHHDGTSADNMAALAVSIRREHFDVDAPYELSFSNYGSMLGLDEDDIGAVGRHGRGAGRTPVRRSEPLRSRRRGAMTPAGRRREARPARRSSRMQPRRCRSTEASRRR